MLLRYLNFCRDSGHLRKRLDKKASINFKICDVKGWQTNNYNTHTVQYPKKWSSNKIWSVNRILHEKYIYIYFFQKSGRKWDTKASSKSLCFLNRLYTIKQLVSSLVLLYFDRPPIRYTIKQTEEYKTNFFGRREPDFKVSKFYDLFRDLGKFKLQNLSKSSTVVSVIFWNVHKIKTKLQHYFPPSIKNRIESKSCRGMIQNKCKRRNIQFF